MTERAPFQAIVQAAVLILLLLNVIIHDKTTQAQRSLHHWKRDLEHRLKLYQDQQQAIHNIASSSIYPPTLNGAAGPSFNGPVRIASNGNVRFSDLIIPVGSLRLSNHVAPSTVRILIDKTRAYVNSKTNELYQIQSQLENIHRQLDDPTNQYIYKSVRGVPQPRRNHTGFISGTRVFKQPQYVQHIESQNITLRRINYTDINRVIDDTYLRNLKFGVFDSQGRLFLEGRKTFWDTVFSRPLQSGCCDRLRPLHTSRMMLRTAVQDIQAPILIHARDTAYGQTARIDRLSTMQFYNKIIALDLRPNLRFGEIGLVPSPPPENFIQLPNLIDLHTLDQPQMLKTIVFKTPVTIDEALLSNSYVDNRLVIGVSSMPGFAFDLSHDNYLLRYSNPQPNNYTPPVQVISGTLVVDASTSFLAGVDAQTVNRVGNFAQFLQESIVKINRPSTIRGPVQFNALPAMLNRENSVLRPMQNVQILRAYGDLDVGLVNGMRVPADLVILPAAGRVQGDYNARVALRPGQEVRVRGPRHFANRATFFSLQVSSLVNGLALPDGVIPLHLNDFMHTIGHSNLRFLDGITVSAMTVQSAQFDEINLRDAGGDAQTIVIRSMSALQPDGSILVRAPLRVMNLNLINSGPNRGLLNGFRPQEVIELNANNPYEILYGRKKFMAHVEAADCIFNDINQVANWTSHLIRIDRPATVQTVHTQLAFTLPQQAPPTANQSLAAVNIDRLNVDFHPDSDRANHEINWNFSPEFYLLHQALIRNVANYTGGRYRVDHLRLINPNGGLVNNIPLGDIVRLDEPFRFAGTFSLVGKAEIKNTLRAEHITSTYPIDVMNLKEFNNYRIPILGDTPKPISLPSLVLGPDNQASFVQCRMLNGISFNEFAGSIMSLTRPQDVYSNIEFSSPVNFEGPARTTRSASLNGLKDFEQFARRLKQAKYTFEEGLQCNAVVVRT